MIDMYDIYAEGDPHESSLVVERSEHGEWMKREDVAMALHDCMYCRAWERCGEDVRPLSMLCRRLRTRHRVA
jgi:hypothetical protein